MEEQDKVNPEYLKGFNQGYQLEQLSPDLTKAIKEVTSDHPRVKGMQDGAAEYQREKEKQAQRTDKSKEINEDNPSPHTPDRGFEQREFDERE